jgi:hypothetical protein
MLRTGHHMSFAEPKASVGAGDACLEFSEFGMKSV